MENNPQQNKSPYPPSNSGIDLNTNSSNNESNMGFNSTRALLPIVIAILIGITLGFGGYLYGQNNIKNQFEEYKKQYGSQIAYKKYITEPEKLWPDLVTTSSVVYYIYGKLEKNLPATRQADNDQSILHGRELTVAGSTGNKMTFFINEGSATIKEGSSSAMPDGWTDYQLSKAQIGDELFAIVTSPVLKRIDEVTDPNSLHLRSEFVVKITK